MREIKRDIVSAVIFSKDKKIFQGKKDPKLGGVYNDCWHLPGGGVNEGEDKIKALVREIKEEIGIDIFPYEIKLIDDKGFDETEKILKDKDTGEKIICQMNFYIYQVFIEDKTSDEIEIKLEDDLVEYHWVNLSELSSIKITPPSFNLFKRLGYIK